MRQIQLLKNLKRLTYLNRPYNFKFFKGCLSQILLASFQNILAHMLHFFFFNNILRGFKDKLVICFISVVALVVVVVVVFVVFNLCQRNDQGNVYLALHYPNRSQTWRHYMDHYLKNSTNLYSVSCGSQESWKEIKEPKRKHKKPQKFH